MISVTKGSRSPTAMTLGTALQHMQENGCTYLDYNATTPIFPEVTQRKRNKQSSNQGISDAAAEAVMQVSQAMEPYLKLHFGYGACCMSCGIALMPSHNWRSLTELRCPSSAILPALTPMEEEYVSNVSFTVVPSSSESSIMSFAVQSFCGNSQKTGSQYDRCSARRSLFHLEWHRK